MRLTSLPGGSRGVGDVGEATAAPRERGPVPLHIVRTWERDERVAAWDEAQAAADRDPDAAAFLMDCLAADTRGDTAHDRSAADSDDDDSVWMTGSVPPPPRAVGKPFDPMRLIARMARHYRWAHRDIMDMPWITFLAYVREADIAAGEEKAETDRQMEQARRGGQARPGGQRDWPDAM